MFDRLLDSSVFYVIMGYFLSLCIMASLWVMTQSIIVGLLSLVFNGYNIYSCFNSVAGIDRIEKEMEDMG